jgi:hypothetical protein
MKDRIMTIRVNSEQLERLRKALGTDDSKTIRACMNLTENVILRWFGGEITYIFKRDPKDERHDLYKGRWF